MFDTSEKTKIVCMMVVFFVVAMIIITISYKRENFDANIVGKEVYTAVGGSMKSDTPYDTYKDRLTTTSKETQGVAGNWATYEDVRTLASKNQLSPESIAKQLI